MMSMNASSLCDELSVIKSKMENSFVMSVEIWVERGKAIYLMGLLSEQKYYIEYDFCSLQMTIYPDVGGTKKSIVRRKQDCRPSYPDGWRCFPNHLEISEYNLDTFLKYHEISVQECS